MLAGSTLKRIGALEAIRAHNHQLPSVVRLRSNNRNSPISEPIGKHLFDDRSNLCLQSRICRVLHLHRNCHTARKYHPVPRRRKSPNTLPRIPPTGLLQAEYDLDLWRYQPRLLADAETPTGGVRLGLSPPFPPNSNYGSANCSSVRRCTHRQLPSGPGVSETRIAAMSQNGCSRSGTSPWIQAQRRSVPTRALVVVEPEGFRSGPRLIFSLPPVCTMLN